MKTTMKQLTAGTILALLLLVGNAQAKGTEAKASSHDAIETELQLENWMIDDSIWNTNTIAFVEMEQETEGNLDIETWMTSENTWEVVNTIEVQNETEKELQVENWMINNKVWNN